MMFLLIPKKLPKTLRELKTNTSNDEGLDELYYRMK
jgi:hypothetical protein